MNKPYKLGSLICENEQKFFYNNTWCIERYPNYERIVVAPQCNQVDILLDMLRRFEPPYWCLYVLLVSRVGNECGRYQCPNPMSYTELYDFIMKYKDYFEADGRHHIWLGSAKTKQLLVYDNHNIIYIYDDVQRISHYLKEKNFTEQPIEIPFPHSHMYNYENDNYEEAIIKQFEWTRFPLQDQD